VTLKIGLIVNPLAGLGGALGMKGSDSEELRRLAVRQFSEMDEHQKLSRSMERVLRALTLLKDSHCGFDLVTCPGRMGQNVLDKLELEYQLVVGGENNAVFSNADTTRDAALEMERLCVDIVLFAGGDGTARDIFDAIGQRLPVLGIPAGVKMHSGVFAVSPEAA